MTPPSSRILSLLLGGMLIVTACASARPADPAVPSAGSGQTAFDQVIGMLGPDGEVNAQIALESFALAVAPLSSVTPPQGPNHWPDADAAVAWVAQVWDQLAPPQQAAIAEALDRLPDPYSDAGQGRVGSRAVTLAAFRPMTAAAGRNCALSGPDESNASDSGAAGSYLGMMKAAATSITGHLQRAALSRLAVCLVSPQALAGPSLTRVYDADHSSVGLPASCVIFLNTDALGAMGDDLGYLIAWSTFHCFAVTADPTESLASFTARKVRPWVLGGTASWAGATVASEVFGPAGGAHLADVWSGYLTTPGTSLFVRVNSAIGFVAQVDQDLSSAWDTIDAMLLGADGLDSFYAATGRRQSFVDLWAAGYFRDASRGPDWDMYGPGITTDTPEAGSIEVANGSMEEIAAPAMAVATADLTTRADVTILSGNHLRVHDGAQDLKNVRNQAFCTRAGSNANCVCPPGTPGSQLPPLPALGMESKLALTGMEFGGTATISGMSLEDYCGAEPSCRAGIPAGEYEGPLAYATTTPYLTHDGSGSISFTVSASGSVAGSWDLTYVSTSSTGEMGTGVVTAGSVTGNSQELHLDGTNVVATAHGTGTSVPWPQTPLTVQPVCDGHVVAHWEVRTGSAVQQVSVDALPAAQ